MHVNILHLKRGPIYNLTHIWEELEVSKLSFYQNDSLCCVESIQFIPYVNAKNADFV